MAKLYRMAAFTETEQGGNPAGVWVGEVLPEASRMQEIAADVGYPETAFVAPENGSNREIRYFSPQIEVPFCGHATIATGAVLGPPKSATEYQLATAAGEVRLRVESTASGPYATLTSVATRQREISEARVAQYLEVLDWPAAALDPNYPVMVAFAGAWHLILAVTSRQQLACLEYDFNALKSLMQEDELTTLQLIFCESEALIHARNPFPVGGIVEDPATGAAGAALGGYLRDQGILAAPFEFAIHQGDDMGRPSRLTVSVPVEGGIDVSGHAREIMPGE